MAVSYDLAVWEGTPPEPSVALKVYSERMDELDRDYDAEVPPTTRVSLFIDELLSIWPEIDTPAGDYSPWAMSPLMDCAAGSAAYLNLVFPAVSESVPQIVHQARRFGLVCYDPQLEQVLT